MSKCESWRHVGGARWILVVYGRTGWLGDELSDGVDRGLGNGSPRNEVA